MLPVQGRVLWNLLSCWNELDSCESRRRDKEFIPTAVQLILLQRCPKVQAKPMPC